MNRELPIGAAKEAGWTASDFPEVYAKFSGKGVFVGPQPAAIYPSMPPPRRGGREAGFPDG